MTNFSMMCDEIGSIAHDELVRIKKKYPLYASSHEGYAILLEEVEEAREMLENIEEQVKVLWLAVREDNRNEVLRILPKIRDYAINSGAELAQVAAVTQKFIESEVTKDE